MMDVELKGCPWCGNHPTVRENDFGGYRPSYIVQCSNVHCMASEVKVEDFSESEAITAWNTRHDHSPDAGKMGEEWRTIESAPEGQLLVVCWRDEEDTEHPDRYEFDYLEDGVWQKHSDDYEHFCAVAPAGSRGPSEQAPYIGWRPLPAARAGERGFSCES